MKFSVCIPNYNYARYIGKTIQSVLAQDVDFEVLVSDNASTDASVEVVRAIGDERVRVSVNQCNVGFSGNLDRAAQRAGGDLMMLLSSDDLLLPGCLEQYRRLFELLDARGERAIVSASCEIIDEEDRITGRIGPAASLWPESSLDQRLSEALGVRVLRREPQDLLRDCLRTMKNPFTFAATVYGRSLYRRIEGYGASKLINPDKWFNWRALGVATNACFVDAPLVAYRWHNANQASQEESQGALKYLVDEYVSTLEFDAVLLVSCPINNITFRLPRECLSTSTRTAGHSRCRTR